MYESDSSANPTNDNSGKMTKSQMPNTNLGCEIFGYSRKSWTEPSAKK
jgi:hypothetical protein